jgi:hypothetical protein
MGEHKPEGDVAPLRIPIVIRLLRDGRYLIGPHIVVAVQQRHHAEVAIDPRLDGNGAKRLTGKFAADSSLEGTGFELSVPPKSRGRSEAAPPRPGLALSGLSDAEAGGRP